MQLVLSIVSPELEVLSVVSDSKRSLLMELTPGFTLL
jgi:hypothetical protein